MGKMIFSRGHLEADRCSIEEAPGQQRLEARVGGMLRRVERELDEVESKIGSKLRVLDLDNDGVVSRRAAAGGRRPPAGLALRVDPCCRYSRADRRLCHRNWLQISPDELRNAMSFLKEQLGEEELRGMLETLNAEARGDGGIDVAKLMDLAHGEDGDKSD